ncbi:MAG: hypothetical protein NG784_03140 [Candidatus Jettenia sp.]|nr:hypothetical protein [Candidatus Jettenia sp.]
MISQQSRWNWIYISVLSIIVISGCSTEKPPQEAAQKFWDAIKIQDIENARKYATVETRDLIDTARGQFRDTNVTFGKILIDGDTTTIETTLHMDKNGTETTLPLQTILKKEHGEWKVDYRQTRQSIKETDTLPDIAKDIQELGKKLSDHMDEALGEIKQKIPEYEEKIKELGEAASKKMEEVWQRQVAEIKKNIEKLGKILDEVLKEEGKNDQQDKP